MRDGYLEFLISMAESDPPLECDVTLCVDGFLISGVIISREKYMQHTELTRQMQEAIDKIEAKEKLENPEKEPEPEKRRRFLHLRDAKYFTSSLHAIPTSGTTTIRVKIGSVSAFNFGSLNHGPPSDADA